jgi:hypothetical protein
MSLAELNVCQMSHIPRVEADTLVAKCLTMVYGNYAQ